MCCEPWLLEAVLRAAPLHDASAPTSPVLRETSSVLSLKRSSRAEDQPTTNTVTLFPRCFSTSLAIYMTTAMNMVV